MQQTNFVFKSTYENLPSQFYSREETPAFLKAKRLFLNQDLYEKLTQNNGPTQNFNLDDLLSGRKKHPQATYLSLAYAGHQFGNFVPLLGDGRAILIGEILDKENNLYDLQIKGIGPTNYSRYGTDGKSPLAPALREYLISKAISQLKIPTTHGLAVYETGETVYRNQQEPGGFVIRVAKSHIRIGTFEYAAALAKPHLLEELTRYTVKRHFPYIQNDTDVIINFIQEVAKKQAFMVAKWMGVGFIHGVMNTDNFSLTGETLDYGPCAFMDQYKASQTYSSIDRYGRYAYNQQIEIAKWNLTRFASCFIKVLHPNENKSIQILEKLLEELFKIYDKEWEMILHQKFGFEKSNSESKQFIKNFMQVMEHEHLDFTNTFRSLSFPEKRPAQLGALMDNWSHILQEQNLSMAKTQSKLKKINPQIIPRNHIVENALAQAYQNNLEEYEKLYELIQNPFEEKNIDSKYLTPPKKGQEITRTFCGT